MQADKRKGETPPAYPPESSQLKRWIYRSMMIVLGMLMLVSMFYMPLPAVVHAATDSLEITGDGVTDPLTLTLTQLEEMEQYQYTYSCINTWPTKKWYVGKGVKLSDLLARAGMTDEARLLKFTAVDGYTVTLTVKELLKDKRYRFPNFKSGGGDGDGHTPGDPSGQVEVVTIIGLVSVEGSDNPQYMNDLNTLLLMLGQRAVTEQTGNLFVKYLNKIEVLTDEPEKWDAPQANPDSSTVPAGTMVTLSNLHNDDDKIYYTTDGSEPTRNSPMYNWIAKRWWSSRADVLGTINHPIGPIEKDTIIKAVTIGPGKADSDVVTFKYQVSGAEPDNGTSTSTVTPGPEESETTEEHGTDEMKGEVPGKPSQKIIKLAIDRMEADIDGNTCALEAAPYLNTEVGRVLVPVRFVSEALGAGVNWNPEKGQITVTDEGKEILLTLGSGNVQINGIPQAVDCVPVTLPPGRTFIPLRFVSETLGAKVGYKAETGEITITR